MADPDRDVDEVVWGPLRFSYIWLIVGVLFLGAVLIQGTALGGIVVFDERILKTLKISRSALKFRDLLYVMSGSGSCLVMAWLCRTIGARTIVTLGLCGISLVLLGYSAASSIWWIYALQVLLGFSFACVHVVVIMMVLERWLEPEDPRRAIALGVCVSGASFGAVVIAQVAALLLTHVPWREAFLVMAVLPLPVIPLAWAVIRTPSDARKGLWGSVRAGAMGYSFRTFGSPTTLVMLGAIMPVFYVGACIASNTVLILRDQGLPIMVAATGLSTMFIAALVGKFASGFLLLKAPMQASWIFVIVLMLVGSVILVALPHRGVFVALGFLGLGWGGCYSLAQLKIGEIFSSADLVQVLGAFVVFEAIGSAAGAWLTAVMFDHTGSYRAPLMVNVALLVVAIGASLLVTRMARARRASACVLAE